MDSINITNARKDLYNLVARTQDSHEPVQIIGKNAAAVLVSSEDWDAIMETLRRAGHTPYAFPVGGSVPLGSLGYVGCTEEIAAQSKALGISFDAIVSATGSGGTYAGLTYGATCPAPGLWVSACATTPSRTSPWT